MQRQVIGVADPSRAELVLGTLRQRGAKHVWVVHGNGLDELSTTGPSIVHELIDDTINTFTIDATELGLAPPAGTTSLEEDQPKTRGRSKRVERHTEARIAHRRTQRSCCARRRW